jgi:hypothetical protein
MIESARDVENLFLKKIVEFDKEEREKRRNELHITDLTSECLRQIWFEKKEPLPDEPSNNIRMWQGRMMHEMPLLKHHELELEYDGVKTRIDEYDDSGILIEKKFVSFIPKTEDELRKYYSHYIKQVEYEALMLFANDKPISRAFLLFVCRGEPESNRPPIIAFEIKLDLESIAARFAEEVEVLKHVLDSNEPPIIPKNFSPFEYPCSYCKYRIRCFSTI